MRTVGQVIHQKNMKIVRRVRKKSESVHEKESFTSAEFVNVKLWMNSI